MKVLSGKGILSEETQFSIACSEMNADGFRWCLISSPSPPAAPDPATTSAAQTASNQQTALYQAGLNDVNQNTPLGDISYDINPTGNGGGYDTQAYNQAMTAWQGAGGGTSPALSPGLTQAQFNAQTGKSGSVAYQSYLNGKYPGMGGNSSPMPQLSQFANSGATPTTTSTITLNPQVQSILDSTLASAGGLANLGTEYEQNAANQISQPYNINANVGSAPQPNAAFQQSAMNNMNALEQPYVDRSNEQLQASLAAQGITNGSQAYNNAQLDQNNALNNLQEQNISNATSQEQAQYGMADTGYQQNLSNYNTQYNQPLNETTALMSGSQVSQPQFSQPSPTSVSPTNVAGIYNQAYQNQLGASNAATASNNQLLGGLFGLGGSLGAASIMSPTAFSDRRLKAFIRYVGRTAQGLRVYRYKYKSGGGWQMGVMADELEKIMPHAVLTGADGFKMVNYGALV